MSGGAPSALTGVVTAADAEASGALTTSSVPSWMGAAGQWSALPSSRLDTSGVGWSGTSPGGSGVFTSTVLAWGGGVLNTVGCYYAGAFHAGTYVVLHGGGHGDYGGNEVYAYGPIEDDAPAWRRLTDPTIPAPTNVLRDGSGNPVSSHTYDTLHYLPTLNKLLRFGVGARFSSGNSGNAADLFDFATNTWSGAPDLVGIGSNGLYDACGGYNSTTGKAWLAGIGNGGSLWSYDVATQVMSNFTLNNPNYSTNSKAAVDPVRNLWISFTAAGGLQAVDLASPSSTMLTLSTTGTGPTGGKWCLDWDETHSRFVAWNEGAGTSLFVLTPPASSPLTNPWVWSSLSGSGGATPSTSTGNGVYGRFRATQLFDGGVILMPGVNTPICFYRF